MTKAEKDKHIVAFIDKQRQAVGAYELIADSLKDLALYGDTPERRAKLLEQNLREIDRRLDALKVAQKQ